MLCSLLMIDGTWFVIWLTFAFLYIASQAASANSNRMACSYFSATDTVKMGNILISIGTTKSIIFVYRACFMCVGGSMCCVGGRGLGDGVGLGMGGRSMVLASLTSLLSSFISFVMLDIFK